MSFTSSFGGGGFDLGNRMYEEFKTVSSYFCNGLFSIGEDGFRTRRIARLCSLLGRSEDPERKFSKLRNHSYIEDAQYKGG